MKLSKWGNSLGVRLPAAVVQSENLKEGDTIEVHFRSGRVLEISRDLRSRKRWKKSASCGVLCLPASNLTAKSCMSGECTQISPEGVMTPRVFFDTNVLLYLYSAEEGYARSRGTLAGHRGRCQCSSARTSWCRLPARNSR